jgi:glycosyltransferase involved in cell wall biosynthesis
VRWRDRVQPAHDAQAWVRSIARLCAAARWARDPVRVQSLQVCIRRRLAEPRLAGVNWSEFVPDIHDGRLVKAVILKPYLGPSEKGVVFISFENEWGKLLGRRDLPELAARYNLVLAPSGSPHNLINYAFAAAWPGTLFTLISNAGDADVLPAVSEKFVVVPLYASSWVNPAWFAPRPKAQRAFDLIMVANFAKFKRHHVLFRALRSMPRDLRILLVGQNQDRRTAESIASEARWYGVHNRFELRVNLPYAQVIDSFCNSRASVILSRREGSCVVVAESLFADAPAAVLDNAELGSRAFINEQTGALLHESELAEHLAAFVRAADRITPRPWAEANISCWKSGQRLNAILRDHALARAQAWTRDLAPMQWCPDPQLIRDEDRSWLRDEQRALTERFGLRIGPDVCCDRRQ